MKEIELTRSKVALVDDEDYDFLNQFKWRAIIRKNTCYAMTTVRRDKKEIGILLHRMIMGFPNKMLIDHRDRNGLNCQKYNLRICNNFQNNMNRTAFGRSKYLGVNYSRKYIQSRITVYGKRIFLGIFETEESAALAYNEAAIKYYGEFANLNIISL